MRVRILRRRVAVAALALVACVGCGGGEPPTSPGGPSGPAGRMSRGPYLQHADDGLAVVWYTDAFGAGSVRFFSEDGLVAGEAPATAAGARHAATLRGLLPGTRYRYRVYAPAGVLVAVGGETEFSFRTPEPDVLRLVVFGDSGQASPAQFEVARAIAAETPLPDLVLITGDLVYPPFDASTFDAKFFAPYAALLAQVPFYAAVGNHDYEYENGRPFFEVFDLPRNGPAGLAPESSFWLERAGAQLVVHDSNQSAALLRQHAIPWHNELGRRPAVFRLAFQHHTMWSSGPNFALPPSPQLRALLGPVYTANAVDVEFNGHDHLYERTRPIGGVIYVTTGAGGAELYARAATNAFTLAFANDRHGYTHVEVRGRTLLLRQMDTAGRGYDALALTKPVAVGDALVDFGSASAPPAGWREAGFDDSAWRERPAGPGRLRARRSFDLPGLEGAREAVLRVRGVSDWRVWLNGNELAREASLEAVPSTLSIPPDRLRPGRNLLALDGFAAAGETASLELLLASAAPAR